MKTAFSINKKVIEPPFSECAIDVIRHLLYSDEAGQLEHTEVYN